MRKRNEIERGEQRNRMDERENGDK